MPAFGLKIFWCFTHIRKIHFSSEGVMVWADLDKSVIFSGDSPKTCTYQSDEHGRKLYKHFCPTCGTTVSLTTERFPSGRVMMIGTLDYPSLVKVDTHMFADST
jgi:hypothetical protein